MMMKTLQHTDNSPRRHNDRHNNQLKDSGSSFSQTREEARGTFCNIKLLH